MAGVGDMAAEECTAGAVVCAAAEASEVVADFAAEADSGVGTAASAAFEDTAAPITPVSTVTTIRSGGITATHGIMATTAMDIRITTPRPVPITGMEARTPPVLVISNQAPPQPVIVQPPPAPAAWESGPTAQTQKYEDTLFLLAMRDGTIRAVLAYWVDGATVHYVTMDHEQKQASLASLDRSLSERLNRERNVTFRLPG